MAGNGSSVSSTVQGCPAASCARASANATVAMGQGRKRQGAGEGVHRVVGPVLSARADSPSRNSALGWSGSRREHLVQQRFCLGVAAGTAMRDGQEQRFDRIGHGGDGRSCLG